MDTETLFQRVADELRKFEHDVEAMKALQALREQLRAEKEWGRKQADFASTAAVEADSMREKRDDWKRRAKMLHRISMDRAEREREYGDRMETAEAELEGLMALGAQQREQLRAHFGSND